jgi:hypothetical protein
MIEVFEESDRITYGCKETFLRRKPRAAIAPHECAASCTASSDIPKSKLALAYWFDLVMLNFLDRNKYKVKN